MCLKYAELEKSLAEIDRVRRVYVYGSQFSRPQYDAEFWNKWLEFEVQYGNEDTCRDMLRIKRSVSASYSQTDSVLPEHMMQKDQRLSIDGEIKVSASYHEEMH
ncbi:putative tetratricopeptide-like helical domain-containing protein [Rosa chinensis]|uniref:Putative tetratricopeptide-like helical domain-containing protein n=1 Tax=Rosa chinensis TaxID=74649 RepID=A0A2P6Q3G5_ROSCH|nr:putative tetratricopeptide-like helical domain-containing protein [Rosa chinensis]